jgi:hypothetical protein
MPPFTSPIFTYAEAESALGAALDFGLVHQRGIIKLRLKHLQRLNLIELNLGKQRRAKYSRAQITLWLLALILAETGADPTLVVTTLKNNWKSLVGTIERATSYEARSGQPYYLCLYPRVLSAPVVQQPPLSIEIFQIRQPNPFTPGYDELRQLVDAHRDGWFCIHNITRPLSRLENAL